MGSSSVQRPDHQPTHLIQEAEAGRALAHRHDLMLAQQHDRADDQQIAEEQTVDRLADGRGILPNVDQQKHDQLAGEEDHRTRRDNDCPWQLYVERRGKVRLDEVHCAECAVKHANADAMAQPEQAGHHGKVEGPLCQQQKHIRVFAHSGRPHPISPRKSVPKLHDGGYQQVDVNAENSRISA